VVTLAESVSVSFLISPDVGVTRSQLEFFDTVQFLVRSVGTGLRVIVCAEGAPPPAVEVNVMPEGDRF